MLPSCAYCGDNYISLDTPNDSQPMWKDFLKRKELIPKGRSKADEETFIKDSVKNVQK